MLTDTVEHKYQEFMQRGYALDLTRGKPNSEQLNLSLELFSHPDVSQIDSSILNYGNLWGIDGCKQLGARLLDMPREQVLAGGNSSLSLMYLAFLFCYEKGLGKASAWKDISNPTFICLTPGYDRHFSICEHFEVKMLDIPLLEDDVDIEAIEQAVAQSNVVGMWCVPQYSNPTGHTYSKETIKRLANLKPANSSFKIFWDNAYSCHHLYDDSTSLENIWQANPEADHILQFASTSKITLAGGGVSFIGSSTENMQQFVKHLGIFTIGFDKVNQMRHTQYLPDEASLNSLMNKHAAILRPRFELVLEALETLDKDLCSFSKPRGGYFISFQSKQAPASRIIELAKQAGVSLTPAGSTHPYKNDPTDSYIRLAPTYLSLKELEQAMEVFCCCVEKAAV